MDESGVDPATGLKFGIGSKGVVGEDLLILDRPELSNPRVVANLLYLWPNLCVSVET